MAPKWSRRDVLELLAVTGMAAPASSMVAFAAEGLLGKLRDAGVVRVGMANQPPYSGLNPDGSVTGIDPYPSDRTRHLDDPVLDPLTTLLGGAFSAYAEGELGYRSAETYRVLNPRVGRNWEWMSGRRSQGFRGAADDLQVQRQRGDDPEHPEADGDARDRTEPVVGHPEVRQRQQGVVPLRALEFGLPSRH